MRNKKPKIANAPNAQKAPQARFKPQTEKQPKAAQSVRGGQIMWRFSSVDRGGPFSWSRLDKPDEYKEALEKLHQFETMASQDLDQQGSHVVELSSCCKEARDRLLEIKRDDVDELMSFRLTGKIRVWCTMVGSVMSVLWWDPEHKVCPSLKKGT